MARMPRPSLDPDDAPLKRLGGGRWQTRDERFTIEPQSGTWVIVDGEQTDDLGMALVRGPFPSLTTAKAAIATARSSAPPASPLAERIERRRREPSTGPPEREPTQGSTKRGPPRQATTGPSEAKGGGAAKQVRSGVAPARAATRGRSAATETDQPPEPGWLTDLDPTARGRARRLIARLRAEGMPDAAGLVRRDVVGNVPALAAAAIGRRLAGLDEDATPGEIAALLADGRDEQLGVRWRLVDGEGRPIVLDHTPGSRR